MVGRLFLGRYQAIRLLGEGGMGRVYLAKQLDLGRQVVVKVMHDHVAADPTFRERFHRETLLMARFQHPYAVTLYDASLDDPQGPCIVMEYIRGVTLDSLLEKNSRLSPPRVGRLLGQLCEVLQAAHGEGIIHRDLKPANLMVVNPDTPYEKIKVMDFGLATLLDAHSRKKSTDSNQEFAVGTPGYMCPEQVRGEEMDHRGDLYSVGIILYELLSGRRPFAGRSSMDTMLAHATEEPCSFAEAGDGVWISPSVEAVVMSCLAKDPGKRPAHARDLADRFQFALEEEYQQPSQPASQPSPVVEEEPAAEIPKVVDPNSVVHQLDAWMPEQIAVYKLKGFVEDAAGEVLESEPGRIRVLLGGRGSVYTVPNPSPLAWLGFGRKAAQIELELSMHRSTSERNSLIHITVTMRSYPRAVPGNADWRERCNRIFCDLRSYLMGSTSAVAVG